MPQCYVVACKATHRNRKCVQVKFHRFPVNMKVKWLQALGEDPNKYLKKFSVICSRHFKDEDYETRGSIRKLRKDAVPSLNIFSEYEDTLLSQPGTSKMSPCPESITSNTEESGNESEQQKGVKRKNYNSDLYTTDSSSSSPKKRKFVKPTSTKKKRRMTKAKQTFRKYIESDVTSTDSSSKSPQKKELVDANQFEKTPPKDIPSSAERKRRIIRRMHCYSHSPDHAHKQLIIQRQRNKVMKYKLKCAAKKNKRLLRKVSSLHEILRDLREKRKLCDDGLENLEHSISGIPLILMKRLIISTKYGKKLRTKYPPELRSFAMTLQFYSCKAYEYVRNTFNHALPHQSVIRSWYSKVDCEPGYSKPAFDELQKKVVEGKTMNKEIFCSLMLDEMSIKKQIEFDGKCTRGYVDIGSNINNDESVEATQALVIMVVAINDHWKVPVAYFLIKSLNAQERAGIVMETLHRLHNVGIHIVSLTCDGPSVHFKMMKILGCNVTDLEDTQSWFQHPVTKQKVFIIFDVCHMLKLVRNNWAKLGRIKDPEGNIINWHYIEQLHVYQEEEIFSFGTKITRRHIEWDKQKMKVRLAAHTLSASVADALLFLQEDMKVVEFAEVTATVKFIRIVDQLFDLLNSRNPYGKGYKSPMRNENISFWQPFLENTIIYLKGCTTLNDIKLFRTANKTPVIGFIKTMQSMIGIAENYLATNKLKYILAYKFSQDHIELFFCSMRSRNGWNNNPTALQFIRSYKRLLLHHDIKNLSGNCIPQDETNVLFVSSARNEMSSSDIFKRRISDGTIENIEEQVEELPITLTMSDLTENVITYISGYVVKMMQRKLVCVDCRKELIAESYPQNDSSYNFLKRKQRGGLIIPSKSVKEICRYVEMKIRNIYVLNDNKMPNNQHDYVYLIVNKTVEYFLVEKPKIFENVQNHIFDTSITEELHRKKLIQLAAHCYCKIRFFNLAKRQSFKIQGVNIRSSLSRLIIFRNQ